MVIKWDIRNIISFNIEKIETILFITTRKNSLIKLIKNNKFNIGGKKIKFSVNIIK